MSHYLLDIQCGMVATVCVPVNEPVAIVRALIVMSNNKDNGAIIDKA